MRSRVTIFDSASERELFHAIAGSWEPRYHVYPHIPFSNLVDLDPQLLDAGQLSFLHKTTVDYVLVEGEGKPLLGVEFDGIGHGISRHGRYIQKVSTNRDPARHWKLNLKVRVARAAGFPFLVMSYDEKAIVDEETRITVLHGIVGQFLARMQVVPRVQELIAEQQEQLDGMTDAEVQDEIQDMVIAAEIDADMEYNPICRRAAELFTILNRSYGVAGHSYRYLEEPPRPANCFPYEPEFDAKAFQIWWGSIERIGCEHTINTPNGDITRTVWVRNFEGLGVTPFGFIQDLAELVTSKTALVELGKATSIRP